MTKLRWLIVVALVVFGAPNVWAADGTWDNPAGGVWNEPTNWVGGVASGGNINDIQTFGDVLTGDAVVDHNGIGFPSAPGGAIQTGGMIFDSPYSYTISGPGGWNPIDLRQDITIQVLRGNHTLTGGQFLGYNPGGGGDAYITFDVAGGYTLTMDKWLGDDQVHLGIRKTGPGTVDMIRNQSDYGRHYWLKTIVSEGTYLVNDPDDGSHGVGKDIVEVNGTGTLGGSGNIGTRVDVSAGASIAPGSSVGTLTLWDGLTLNDGSNLAFDLGETSDLLMVTGGTFTGSEAAGVTVSIADAGGLVPGNTYDLINFNGATPSGVDVDDFLAAGPYAGSAFGISDGILQVTVVPEPGTIVMLLGGLVVGLVLLRRRRR